MSQKLVKLILFLVFAAGLLVSAGLYTTLIYTNCESGGVADLIGDFGDFHSREGC
ncbi:hypothetical protein [Arthrobacter sp. G119Y2]|uniref:hypothetical protein n=1 Tax=Arthrobacter sp. G119Y2 TaxID=3134965 RepID=UPI00311911B7